MSPAAASGATACKRRGTRLAGRRGRRRVPFRRRLVVLTSPPLLLSFENGTVPLTVRLC